MSVIEDATHVHTLSILQSILSPLRLQVTPVLAKVKASLILSICEQSGIAQLCAGVCLCPQSYSDGVGALVIDDTRREGKSCLRADLRDEFAICGRKKRLAMSMVWLRRDTYIGSH